MKSIVSKFITLAGASAGVVTGGYIYLQDPQDHNSFSTDNVNSNSSEPATILPPQGGIRVLLHNPDLSAVINPGFVQANEKAVNNVIDESRIEVTLGEGGDHYASVRLTNEDGLNCSAFLVGNYDHAPGYGEDTLTTAGHCFMDEAGVLIAPLEEYKVIMQYYNHDTNQWMESWSRLVPETVKSIFDGVGGLDIAIAKLAYPIAPASYVTPYNISNTLHDIESLNVISVAYPGDRIGLSMDTCALTGTDKGLLKGNCDAAKGSSGSALLSSINGKYEVVGVTSALYDQGSFATLYMPLSLELLNSLQFNDIFSGIFGENSKKLVRQEAQCVQIEASKLHLRLGAGTDTPIIGGFYKGEVVEVLSEELGWYEVPQEGSGTGFIYGGFTTKPSPC